MLSSELPRLLLSMSPDLVLDDFLDADARARIERLSRWAPPGIAFGAEDLPEAELAEAEVLITSWGAPVMDEAFLARAPRLRAVIHAAGSVKGFVTDAAWARGIEVSTAAWANAVPVAEYTVAAILFGGKHALELRERYRRTHSEAGLREEFRAVGNYRRTVGIVGASQVGRRVIALLREHDISIKLYDPYLTSAEAAQLGAVCVGLDELCATSDVISLHAPELPETRHMLDARRLGLIPDGATLINTARGSLVDTAALVSELVGGRLRAILDIVEPMPAADSPLFELPNVFLTPHIAGSFGNELRRLGDAAVDELERLTRGQPFAHATTHRELARSA
jgi:phosphoglycerate dehydrogenase-like enzyme